MIKRHKLNRKHNKDLIRVAKNLRSNMTKEEKHLWYDYLKNYKVRFSRQKILGKYVADFYCAKANLVIELDGSQHYQEKELDYDKARTEYLSKFNIKVVRIPNNEVNKNFDGVCRYIDMTVQQNLKN
ncbi:MAG: endonuclease domain-containing protein [Ruminococcus sp.]|jgi:very-short-patch-repair endonuclease|nr:endonuclease domain-containing protein [Ruminococcus sp.]HJI49251.1 endonuclease domain-containing protein [Oscillospiraceae bacterium]